MTDDGLGWLRERPQEGEVLIANNTGQTYTVDEQHWLENGDELERAGWHKVEETEGEATA